MVPACLGPAGDAAFGPRVTIACRDFDFTAYFEDVFFACLPYTLLVLAASVSLVSLWKKPQVNRFSRLLWSKQVAFIFLFICQTVFLILRVTQESSTFKTHASIPADILGVVAAISAAVLSYQHHLRSIRPSTTLAVLLSVISLLGAARVRTLWLTCVGGSNGPAITCSLALLLTLLLLGLESASKQSILDWKTLKTTEPLSGFWKRLIFGWLASTFHQGYSTILSVDSLPDLDPELASHKLHQELEFVWSKGDRNRKNALIVVCLRCYRWAFLSAIIPRLCLTGFTFAQPFLIESTIEYVGTSDANRDYGKGLIGAFALVFLGIAASTACYWYQTFRFVVRLRGGLVSLIHRHTLRARAVDLGDITAVTLMSTDTERIVSGFRSIHEVWGSLVDIGVAMYLLERQVSAAFVAPVIIVLVFLAITVKLSMMSSGSQRVWVEKIEDRIRLTSRMLGDMKAVKMLGLSSQMSSVIQGMRVLEVRASETFRTLLIGQLFLSNAPAFLAPVATFAVFTISSWAKGDSSLLAAKAFTSLTLISLLTSPVLTFLQAIPSVLECVGCFDRIQEYCRTPVLEALQDDCSDASNHSESPATVSSTAIPLEQMNTGSSPLVSFEGQSFAWSKSSRPVVRNLTLDIKAGTVTMVIGPVGSGKSALLESILGETVSKGGQTRRYLTTRIAYCSQTPWLRETSIRENILGFSDMEPKWYAAVLRACGLEEDLDQFPMQDETQVGSNGTGLSGGQKQRISLARALYSRCKLLLLDDVFSGLDAPSTTLIANRLFGNSGLIRQNSLSVVLATHNNSLLPHADEVIMLDDGEVRKIGRYETLKEETHLPPLPPHPPAESSVRLIKPPETTRSEHGPTQNVEPTGNDAANFDLVIEDMKRQSGDFSVYNYYAKAAGYRYFILFVIMMLFGAFFREFTSIWLDWWSSSNASHPNKNADTYYLCVYAALAAAGMISLLTGAWSYVIKMINNSAITLHSELLRSVICYHDHKVDQALQRAPFYFFQTTNVGTLTNRFSQDMELIDLNLPMTAINYVHSGTDLLVKGVIVAVYAKYLAIAAPIVIGFLYLVQKFYLRTSRQIRLLEIEAKAPLYTHFLETVTGSSAIRAFGPQWQSAFETELYHHLDFSQRPLYLLLCIQQCLALVLDLLVAVLAITVVGIITTWKTSFDPGDVGVALSQLITFSATLMDTIKFWTRMEQSIGAVSRVKDFVDSTESGEASGKALPAPHNWPSVGTIQFSDVKAAYSPQADLVLRGVSVSINAGERVAIVGRSGSGKTSLILSLLQMTDIQEGTVSIDGIDTATLSRMDLRSKINVITQDPFLMPGSMRFNMDPFGTATDEEICSALKRLALWDLVKSEGGLDTDIGTAWSAGQKQLFCLARATLRNAKILVLDEATSSVDDETEAIMQKAIDSEFPNVTILAVVHRLRFIESYDRVCVMDRGYLVDVDSPAVLLAKNSASTLLKSEFVGPDVGREGEK